MYTPLELQKMTFSKTAFSGYKTDEVDESLSLIAKDYEALYKENIALKDKVQVLDGLVQKYKSMEETLNNALLVAQSTSDELHKNAQEKAEQIVKDAELQSQSMLMKTSEEITALQIKKEEMRQNVTAFAAKLNALLNAQIDLLKGLSEDL